MSGWLCVWEFPERNSLVHLPVRVLAEMRRLARKALPDETGGTLVGHYSGDRLIAHVEVALGVKRRGRATPTSFYRPPDSVDPQLEDMFKVSEGESYYLGEWHSHPGGLAKLSEIDKRTMTDLAGAASVATDTPIIILIGGDPSERIAVGCFIATAMGDFIEGRPLDKSKG